jgi:hypothetical protein
LKDNQQKHFAVEPHVGFGDYHLVPRTSWEDIDGKASEVLGQECIGIPSVRVAIGWTLEFLGCKRHSNQVLVPKFMGRCILNALSRYALPVEELTPRTALVVAVHQYGLKQDLDAVQKECVSRGLPYVEDSPYGLETQEELGPGSLAKFIGLTKVLPVLKGGVVISRDRSIMEFFKRKRGEASVWSWVVLGAMALLRRRRRVGDYSALADAAYEMFVQCKGDNVYLRANVIQALGRLDSFAAESRRRLTMAVHLLGQQVHIPDTQRISYVAPYFPESALAEAQLAFSANGFDPGTYHVDLARNLFSPRYDEGLLIPLNTKIPAERFESLVTSLSKIRGPQGSSSSPNVAPVMPI